jgi:hypothetical protein
MVGAEADYPPASGELGNKIDTVKAAGWVGEMCAGDGGNWKGVCD